MPRRSDTRERVLDVGTRAFRRQGYAATGLKQIVAEGGAPIGSLYHFFPGGKQQVGEEALARWGERSAEAIDSVFAESKDIARATRRWFGAAADALVESGYAEGCPVGTVAYEVAGTNEALRVVCADAFESWRERVARRLVADGVGRRDAEQLAGFAVATLEGAYMLSRVTRSRKPLDDCGKLVAATLRAAPRRSRRGPRSAS